MALMQSLAGHRGIVWSVAFSPDGERLASACEDRTVRIWDVAGAQEVRRFKHHTDVMQVAWATPDEIWSRAGKYLYQWSPASETPQRRLSVPQLYGFGMSGDGARTAVLLLNGTSRIKLWETAQCTTLHEFKGRREVWSAMAISPDGRSVACAVQDEKKLTTANSTLGQCPSSIRIFRTDGASPMEWEAHHDCINETAFSSDGESLATASMDGTVAAWTVRDGSLLWRGTCSASPESVGVRIGEVVTGDDGGAVQMWSRSGSREIFHHAGPIYSVAICPQGRTVAVGAADLVALIPC